MSAARRSWTQRREDAMARTVRTPEENARAAADGRRAQLDLIVSMLRDGTITDQQARDYCDRFGFPIAVVEHIDDLCAIDACAHHRVTA